MTNSELKFVAKVFSHICRYAPTMCVHYIYTDGRYDKAEPWDDNCYDLLSDAFYDGDIDDCPLKNTGLKCVDCTEQAWYRFLKQMEKKYPRKGEEKHDD